MRISSQVKLVLLSSLISAALVILVVSLIDNNRSNLTLDAEIKTSAPLLSDSSARAAPNTQLTADEQVNVRIYKEVSPGVVNIVSRSVGYDIFLEPVQSEAVGSGAVIDQEGHIVTNYHVIEEAEQLEVTLLGEPNKTYRASVVGSDPNNDLAVIKIRAPKEKLHPIRFGDSKNLQVGQKVLAIGNPFRLQGTLTVGVISALGRTIRAPNGRMIYDVIQTDAAINQGNSGGPLLNTSGELIGINTMIFTPSGGNVGIGFAIPVATVKRVVNDIVRHGRVIRPWLGISMYNITPDLAESLDLPASKGVMVIEVQRGSPADEAGLRGATGVVRGFMVRIPVGGDIIIAYNGKPVANTDDLTRYMDESRPGDTIKLTIIRDRRKMDVSVRLAEQPGQRRFRF